jgi:hypothetical protein
MVKYETIRSKLQSGDIVLFSGKGGLSTGIKWFTASRWSHLGMVVRPLDFDVVLLWEASPITDIKDIQSGKIHKGVRLVALSERIQTYEGEVAIRLLEVQRNPKMLEALNRLRRELKNRPFEKDVIELLKSAWDGPLGDNVADLSSLFCSELVAEAYQQMGLLSRRKPSNEYTPRDFSEQGQLKLLKGRLGKERAIRKASLSGGDSRGG